MCVCVNFVYFSGGVVDEIWFLHSTGSFLQGNEMCIRPAEFYLFDQEELCFYEIMIRGRQRREIVIGYRLATTERAIINPPDKSKRRKWSIEDVFVVISI